MTAQASKNGVADAHVDPWRQRPAKHAMQLAIWLASGLFLGCVVSAQSILSYGDNALPACAQTCQLLQQAQAACFPPAVPTTDQATYQSCFCQSGYLATLRSSPSGTCDAVCPSPGDQRTIQTWYLSTCQLQDTNTAGEPTTTTTAAATAPTVASTIPGTATSTATGLAAAAAGTSKQSW